MKSTTTNIGSAKYINRINNIKILNLIREKGEISRADLAKKSGLSAPTVTRIVDYLIKKEKLVTIIGAGDSSGGRPPIILKFAAENNFVIGIDLGTTNIVGTLANLNAEFISEVKCPTLVQKGFEDVMSRVADIICEFQNHNIISKNKSRIIGIGMAVAGLINKQKKIVEFSPDFHWHNADILSNLSKRCDHPPLVFDNVNRVMALGELWYGIGKKYKNFICVNVGYGIGAGIIIDGKPLMGLKGIAGEFGHITLDKDSRARCECGNYGCLEALSSGRAIALNAQNELKKGKKSVLFDLCQGNIESITAEMVACAAKQGDDLSKIIFDNAIEYLGIGIAGLVNLFHPEAVVIGGGVAQSGDILFDRIRQIVKLRTMESIAKDLKIIPTTFPQKTAVKGAVSLILSEVLNLSY